MSERLMLAWLLVLLALPAAVMAGAAAENLDDSGVGSEASDPWLVEFAPRPAQSDLDPQNDAEREANIVVLDQRIAISSRLEVLTARTTKLTRQQVRYLVRNHAGVEALKQHTFFGDETGIEILGIQGRTLSADGGVHAIDPQKDIQELDATLGSRRKLPLRTVTFPRVEPGAVLDLAWTSRSRSVDLLDTFAVHSKFPIRRFSLKSQGRLAGEGKPTLTIMGGWYRVPFLLSRMPQHGEIRVSTLNDLELTATDVLPNSEEPFAPPRFRTGTTLGLLTRQFGHQQWRKHAYVLDSEQIMPAGARFDLAWATRSVDQLEPLAPTDELGLQVLPLTKTNARDFQVLQSGLRARTGNYLNFARRSKTGETPADLEAIAPLTLSVDQRIDRILRYAKEQVELDLDGKNWRSLDKLKRKGTTAGGAFAHYVRYLLDQAGLETSEVLVLSRFGLPFVTLFQSWRPFGRQLLLEVSRPSGMPRYLRPDDPLSDGWSLGSASLGALMFRDPGERRTDWSLHRVPIDTPISEQIRARFESDALTAAGPDRSLQVALTFEGADANRVRWSMGLAGKDTDLESLSERRAARVRGLVDRWTGIELDEDFDVQPPDPDADIWAPYRIETSVDWQPNVQTMAGSAVLPAFPDVYLFENPFVAEQRQHPLWLEGGRFEVSMVWNLPPGMAPATLEDRERDGPNGLGFRLKQTWNPSTRQLTSTLNMRQPYILPVSDYQAVRGVFEALQQATSRPILIEPSP